MANGWPPSRHLLRTTRRSAAWRYTGVTSRAPAACGTDFERTREESIDRLDKPTPAAILTEAKGRTDALTELMFLQLWDEASLWIDHPESRMPLWPQT